MNKQPFYHTLSILFTSTTGDTESFEEKVHEAIQLTKGYVKQSLVIEYHEVEAGDPADLV